MVLSGYRLTVVPSLATATRMLKVARFDAVFVDYDLWDGPGTYVVRAARRAQPRALVVAIAADECGNRAMMRAGAHTICKKGDFSEIGNLLDRFGLEAGLRRAG